MSLRVYLLISAVFATYTGLPALAAAVEAETVRAEEGPRYDPATVIDVMVTVVEVRNVPRTATEPGVHVTVKLDSQAVDVYLGPADFVKEFEISFEAGDRLQVIGSRVKFRGADVVLAREVRKQQATVYLRDRRGVPNWSR